MRAGSFLTIAWLVLWVSPCTATDGKAVLWQPPGTITIRDWIWGPGGQARAPQPPFEFIDEDLKGTNPKIRVRDAKGDRWTVKFGGENHGDVFASRLLYAMGYASAPTYFVAGGTIAGAHNLKRARPFLEKDGTFRYARFKLSDHRMRVHVDGPAWSWTDNPFLGTPELNGLKILLMLTSNWDAKDARDGAGGNTGIYSRPGDHTSSLYYAFDDWGATMGKWGGFFQRDKWDPSGYQRQTKNFVRLKTGQAIEWGYRGKHGRDVTAGIRETDVRWLLTYLSRVTDEELRAGLRASGATGPAIEVYARAIRQRIGQLEQLAPPMSSAQAGELRP